MTELIVSNREVRVIAASQALPLDRNPAAVYIASLTSKRSQTVQRHALDKIAGMLTGDRATSLTLPWWELRYQHVAAVRARLAEHYAPSSVNRMLSALRRTLQEAWRLGYIDAETYQKAADVPNVRGETLPAGRALAEGEIGALLDDCANDPSPNGARDAALIALLYGAGLRRAEVVGLDLADYEPDTGKLIVRAGKGRKERTAYLANGAVIAVHDWLAVRGDEPGALFWPTRKGGALERRRMTTQAVYNILAKRAERAKVRDFSPHDMRRSFITNLLDAGADIVTVQKLAGHANPSTTSRYDRRGEEAKRKAVGLVHVPYRGRLV